MSKEAYVVPIPKKTIFEQGVRYYIMKDGKKWDANVYDINFPGKTKIKPSRKREFVPKGRGG